MLASLLNRFGIKLSLNDPRWGRKPEGDPKAQDSKRPGEGPPDLDQMWRDFNVRLNRLFGGKNNGDGPGPGNFRADGKGAGATVALVAVLIGLIWLASGTFIVQEGHRAVVTTFGQPNKDTAGPGLNWRWPAPFQAHETVNVSQVRTQEIGYRGTVRAKDLKEALMLTDDENIIDIQFAVQYTLKDPIAWVFNNRETDETIRQVAETAIREVVGKSKMDFVLYEGREKVAYDTQQLMQVIVDRYKLGAIITNVTMQGVQPPEQVQGAFDDAVKAGQDRARARNEGEAYANNVIPRARGDAVRLTQDAEAYKSMVVENATGNASRFSQVVAEYQKAPAITRDRMYLDTMQQIFTSASKVMIDAKANNSMLYLPLDKLIAQTAANDAAIGSKSGPVQTPMPAELLPPIEQVRQRDNRSREASRDREIR
jgi:membrane protease subunit HflK